MTDTVADLDQATDDALDAARDALLAGWQRLSNTDIDAEPLAAGQGSPHAGWIAADMGALTLPLGTIDRIQRRRVGHPDVLAELADYAAEAESLAERLEAARERVGELVRRAFDNDEPVSSIQQATGLSRQRVYQLRRGTRTW